MARVSDAACEGEEAASRLWWAPRRRITPRLNRECVLVHSVHAREHQHAGHRDADAQRRASQAQAQENLDAGVAPVMFVVPMIGLWGCGLRVGRAVRMSRMVRAMAGVTGGMMA